MCRGFQNARNGDCLKGTLKMRCLLVLRNAWIHFLTVVDLVIEVQERLMDKKYVGLESSTDTWLQSPKYLRVGPKL